MSFSLRRKAVDAPPGQRFRVHRYRDRASLAEVGPGALVVLDHRDLDAETARELVDARPGAVLNAAEYVSGRFANRGPGILADNGITLLEGDRAAVLALKDGTWLRLDRGALYDGAVVALDVAEVPLDEVHRRLDVARAGLSSQLETFAHSTGALLRQEADLLLHGTGAPELRVRLAGRSVLVVGPEARSADLRPLKRFLREQKPALLAVDGGAEALVARGLRPDAVILSGAGTVQPKTLARCREVVLTGPGEAARRRAEQADLPVHETRTSLAGMDLGLLVAERGGARVIVPVGYPATLEDFVDRDRTSQVSNVLTRLRVGTLLVEAAAVPLLYTGRVRRWHVGLALLAAVAVLAVTVAATPIGNGWWHDVAPHLPWGIADRDLR